MKSYARREFIFGFALFFIFIALVIICMSALHKEVVEERVVDARFIESYVGTETDYRYEYDFLGEGGFKLVPHVHSVVYPDEYQFQYEIIYDDGTSSTEWRSATKEEYEKWKRR